MGFLSALGTVAYNGYQFSGAARTKVSFKPVPDRANRTTTRVDYLIQVQDILIPNPGDPNCDNRLATVRQALTARGQRLQFSGQGFGAFDINGVGGQQDVAYGPHPEMGECIQLGQGQAWAFNWRCLTSIPECSNAAYTGRPMAHNYGLEISQDEHGFSKRVVEGYIEIPATRNGANIPDSADPYWESVIDAAPAIAGFKRTWTRKISEDKRTMAYQIVDEEMPPDGFQPDCTAWQGEAEIVVERGGVLAVQTISAEYTIGRSKPKLRALERFFALVMSRVLAGLPFSWISQLIPLRFIVRDQLNGQKVFLSLAYQFGTATPDDILAAAGLFAPIPDNDWNRYRSTLQQELSDRGNADLVYSASSDMIVDLCGTNQESILTSGGVGTTTELRGTLGFDASPPDPRSSYLAYDCSWRVMGEADLHFMKPMTNALQASSYSQLYNDDPNNVYQVPPAGGRLDNTLVSDPNEVPDIVQAGVSQDYYMLLSGGALRAGYGVKLPSVLAINGTPCYLVNVDAQYGIGLNAGIPIHFATWNLLYRCPSKFTTVPANINPVLHAGTAVPDP